MKKLITGLTFVMLTSAAFAADMPVKAPNFSYPNSSGFYVGIDLGASVARASVNGSNPLFVNSLVSGNLNAAGGYVGGCVGYIKGAATSWWGIHSCADYQNITASAPNMPISVASRWDSTTEVRFGGTINPLSLMFNTLSNIGFNGVSFPTFTPVAPTGLNLALTPRSYMAGGIDFKGIEGNFFQSGGTKVAIQPMLKAGAIWQVLNSDGRATGGVVDTYAKVAFGRHGVVVDNVFGTAGGPVVQRGSANLGTTYTAGLAYYFGIPNR